MKQLTFENLAKQFRSAQKDQVTDADMNWALTDIMTDMLGATDRDEHVEAQGTIDVYVELIDALYISQNKSPTSTEIYYLYERLITAARLAYFRSAHPNIIEYLIAEHQKDEDGLHYAYHRCLVSFATNYVSMLGEFDDAEYATMVLSGGFLDLTNIEHIVAQFNECIDMEMK